MQRALAKNLCRHLTPHQARLPLVPTPTPSLDVFINHRGIDTKKNVSGLIYDDLMRTRVRAFLDNKSMKPGDKLFDKIDSAVQNCKLGIAVFSPRYCESYFCLHELSLLMESKKRVMPIFVDVKPSELQVKSNVVWPSDELEKFKWAVREAKYTVGLTFDTTHGDWSEFVKTTRDAVMKNLMEIEEKGRCHMEDCSTIWQVHP